MDYAGQVRKFIAESKEELGRLEEEIDRIREVVARLERFLQGREIGERPNLWGDPPLKEETPLPTSRPSVFSPEGPLPQSASPPFSPSLPDPASTETLLRDNAEGGGEPKAVFRPVGEVAEEMLQRHPGGMSLDELYQAMKDFSEIAPSRDLKNAIRVALIRRRPQVVSPRRGWFRWEGKREG